MTHVCHANKCQTQVPPKMFMCKKHWFMVPQKLRDAIWREYRPGQEIRKDPSGAYLDVAHAAIVAVAEQEREYDRKREEIRRKEHGDQLPFSFDEEAAREDQHDPVSGVGGE